MPGQEAGRLWLGGPRGWSAVGRYEQCDGSVEARVLKHEAGWLWLEGPRGLGAQGLDAGSTTGGVEGKAESTRVIENYVETTDSSD